MATDYPGDDWGRQVQQLSDQMTVSRLRMKRSGEYYESTHRVASIGLSTPPEMRVLSAAIGWGRMYIDSIEERLDVTSFRLSGASEEIEEMRDWWQANDLDEQSSMAHLDALIYGRSYVTVAAPAEDDEPGVPIIRVESPLDLFCEIDPRTKKPTRAVRLYYRQGEVLEEWATLYLPNQTVPLRLVGNTWILDGDIVDHNMGVVPVVPILNRERLSEPEGRSEITPEIRSFTDAAARTFMNMQAAAELMALPQRVLFGVSADEIVTDVDGQSVMDAYMARILTLENEAGKAFSFNAADLRNFTEVLDQLAKHVASYTGLPPQYLSFQSDNPASAEAIKSSESRLVKKCERKARMFGGAWEQVMRLANRVINGTVDPELNRLEAVWADPSTPTYASKVDAATKAYANGMGIIPKERARIDVGYSDVEREEMHEWDRDEKAEFTAQLKEAAAIASANAPAQGAGSSGSKPDKAKPGVNAPGRSTRTGSTTKA